jgi:tRNA A37 threonylcarbamoyladenosine dehydratase
VNDSDHKTSIFEERFSGIARVYGVQGAEKIRSMHIAVVGIGGVGSWAVECLARTGVGSITLIDHDEVCPTNINRQIHALTDSIGRSKPEVMAERVRQINPECDCRVIDDFLTLATLEDYILSDYDYVIDAIDSIKFKSALIYFCKRNKIPIITTGGAGGMSDPGQVKVSDLSRTTNDALAAKVRSRLRQEYGFTRNTKKRFGIECVYSTQQPVYPKIDGGVGYEKPGVHGVHLDCRLGYGSFSGVTATFGFVAASRAINKLLKLC